MPVLLAGAICLSGCGSYQYRITQPAGAGTVGEHPVRLNYAPLEYQLSRWRDRLSVRITNPTEDRISLQTQRSFAVDPRGESHPIHGKVVGPRSYTQLLLPPIPVSYPIYGGGWWGPGWGWGWGVGWYAPYYDPFWGPVYPPPPPAYYELRTPYDWEWKEGPVRLRLSYDQNGKTFEHDFEIVREKQK